jgi:hypothetical protein
MTDIATEREWFEEWATTPPRHFDITPMANREKSQDDYASLATEFAWAGWKRRAELDQEM